MTLKNLLGISLDAVAPDKAHIGKLMAAAQRNMADAQLAGLSTENRFEVPDAVAAECLASASDLHAHVRAWLKVNRPELL